MNLHRRHLNESQRAMIAEKLATRSRGNPKFHQLMELGRKEAAALLNTSTAEIDRARKLRRTDPERAAAVERGEARIGASRQPSEPSAWIRRIVAPGRMRQFGDR